MRKLRKTGGLAMEFCAGTYLTAPTCMLLYRDTKFPGCNADREVPSAAGSDFVLTVATQFPSPRSDISASGEVEKADKFLTEKMPELLAIKKATTWNDPPGLLGTKVTPGHILHFLSTAVANYPLYERCRHISLSVWSPV